MHHLIKASNTIHIHWNSFTVTQWAVRDNREPHYYPHCCLPARATDHISRVERGRRARPVRVTGTVVGIIFLQEPHAGILYVLFLLQLREKQAYPIQYISPLYYYAKRRKRLICNNDLTYQWIHIKNNNNVIIMIIPFDWPHRTEPAGRYTGYPGKGRRCVRVATWGRCGGGTPPARR